MFTSASKSKLGWDFLGVIETGRYKEYAAVAGDTEAQHLEELFLRQAAACERAVRSGPGHHLAFWGGRRARDAGADDWLHDDLPCSTPLPAAILQARDPLEELDEGF